MKREFRAYPFELDSGADYKEEWIHERDKQNYESVTKWLYLGQDINNCCFAKIGITMGDLTARSYSSANPNYRIFCAFKCQYNITKKRLSSIESRAQTHLDAMYASPSLPIKKMRHVDSGRKSECFIDINFLTFFKDLHHYLYENHRNDFAICEFINELGFYEGEFIDLEFNLPTSEAIEYIKKIIEY